MMRAAVFFTAVASVVLGIVAGAADLQPSQDTIHALESVTAAVPALALALFVALPVGVLIAKIALEVQERRPGSHTSGARLP